MFRKLVNKLLVKWDYHNYRNFNKPYPSKRLMKHCWDNWKGGYIGNLVDQVAHMYCYDSTINDKNLDLIFDVYRDELHTRERIRQLLAKFVRENYR